MADNINTDGNTSNELPTDKSKKTDDAAIANNQPTHLTQNHSLNSMEVHHHSHGHSSQNWRSYLKEFFMLFLAVFCGFLAEYQLEHKIEKERGKQFVESMIADLIADSTKIHNALEFCKEQELGLDSLGNLVLSPPYSDYNIKMMYYLAKEYTTSIGNVRFTKRTIEQFRRNAIDKQH